MEIRETKKLFNELRNNFSKKEINKFRRKFRYIKEISEYLKKLEQKKNSNRERKTIKKKTLH